MSRKIVFLVVSTLLFTPALPASAVTCTITVTDSNSTVIGTTGNDVVCIDGDNNVIDTLAGDDEVIDNGTGNLIYLGEGDDTYDGSLGSNVEVYGETDEDSIIGTPGEDEIDAGAGDDTVVGGESKDLIAGGAGTDNLSGNLGDDTITGADGNDTIDGGGGSDDIDSGLGNDSIIGGAGNDYIVSGDGDDSIAGGDGLDLIFGDTGIDSLNGGVGDDTLAGGGDIDLVTDSFGSNLCDYTAGEALVGTCRYDDQAPEFNAFSFDKTSVDVSNSNVVVQLTMSITDDIGIDWFGLNCGVSTQSSTAYLISTKFYKDPSGNWTTDSYGSNAITNISTSGTDQVTQFVVSLSIRKGQYPGTYSCGANVQDVIWNRTFRNNLGVIEIVRSGEFDDAGPTIEKFTINPNPIDVSSSDVAVQISITVVDATSISSLYVNCTNNAKTVIGFQILDYYTHVSDQVNGGLIPFTSKDMTNTEWNLTFQFKIRYGFIPGNYSCTAQTQDGLVNASYSIPLNTTLEVNRIGFFDDDAPTIDSFNFSPSTINVGMTSATTTTIIEATDFSAVASISFICGTASHFSILPTTGMTLGPDTIHTDDWWLADHINNRGTALRSTTNGKSVRFEVDQVIPFGFTPKAFDCSVDVGDTVGNRSQYSFDSALTVIRTQPVTPSAPTNIAVSNIAATSATLAWVAPTYVGSSAITNYTVELSRDNGNNWTSVTKPTTNLTGLNLTNLRGGTDYLVRIAAVNASGSSEYVSGSFTTAVGVPLVPTNLQSTNVSTTTLDLTWSAPGHNGGASISDYTIEYSTNAGSTWQTISHIAFTGTGFSVTLLSPGTSYSFRVSAKNSVGSSSHSNVVTTVTMSSTPMAPTNFRTSSITSTTATIAWNAPSLNGGSSITGYAVEISRDGTNWTPLTSNTTSTNVSGLVANMTYQVRIKANNLLGGSEWLTGEFSTSISNPSSPLNLYSSLLSNSSLSLSWDLPVTNGGSDISDYAIEYSTDGSAFTSITHAASAVRSFNMGGLKPGTKYWFRVAAITSAGTGKYSLSHIVTTTDNPPAAPTKLALKISGTTYTLSWVKAAMSGGSALKNYIVEISSNGGKSWLKVKKSVSTATSLKLTGLKKKITYKLRVTAVNAAGTSGLSKILTFTLK
jgi:hypothetical protein